MIVRLVVSVGSDSHPFDRLVEAVDEWLLATDDSVKAVLQYGTSSPPRHPQGWSSSEPYLPFSELQGHLATADIIVTQGGPTGISEARRLGTQPIVMPRSPARGEHVDGHQISFCRHLAADGDIVLAENTADLRRSLDWALTDLDGLRLLIDAEPPTPDAVQRFEHLVSDLQRRRRWRRRA